MILVRKQGKPSEVNTKKQFKETDNVTVKNKGCDGSNKIDQLLCDSIPFPRWWLQHYFHATRIILWNNGFHEYTRVSLYICAGISVLHLSVYTLSFSFEVKVQVRAFSWRHKVLFSKNSDLKFFLRSPEYIFIKSSCSLAIM